MNFRKPIIKLVDNYIKGNNIHDNLATLRDYYRLSQTRQLQIQEQRLKTLLQHAAGHVPYYRRMLNDAGVVSPSGDIDLSRFNDLPLLTKDILKNEYEWLRSDDLLSRQWRKNTSGGSTGEPVTFIQDDTYADLNLATTLLQFEQVGLELGEPYVKLWGSERDILEGGIGWRANVANYVRNRIFLNSFRMSQKDMVHYAQIIRRRQPVLIEAYADSIYQLAKHINEHEDNVFGVAAIIASAGNLYPFMREEIQEAFQCEVFNRYGAREVGAIALEDRMHSGLQIYRYTHFIEVINQEGGLCSVGEEGEVVVTCLSNYAMPFLRYRIGDRAVPGEIGGHSIESVQYLREIIGRVTDSFIRRDGTVISPFFFIHFLGVVHNSGWIKKTQIIQEDFDQVCVKLMVWDIPPKHTLQELRVSIQKVMGTECEIRFEFVDSIPPSRSGKYRYTMSWVSNSDAA